MICGQALLAPSNLIVDVFHDALHRLGERLCASFAFDQTHPFGQALYLGRDGGQSLGERVVNLIGVGDDDTLAFSKDDVSGHADHSGIVGHVAEHDRAGADAAIASHGDVAENLGASAYDNVVEKRGMPLPAFLAGSAERYSLVERDVIADHGGLADYHAQTVIDKQASADLRAGMDFDTRKPTRHLR